MRRHPRILVAAQLTALAILLGFLGYAIRGAWHDAEPRLRSVDASDLALALAALAAYYCLFVVGWQWILAAWRIPITYRVALRAEMVSMLAKYIPGGFWTPAARVVAVRRAGYGETPLVVASIFLEAGLSRLRGSSSSSRACPSSTRSTRPSCRCSRSASWSSF